MTDSRNTIQLRVRASMRSDLGAMGKQVADVRHGEHRWEPISVADVRSGIDDPTHASLGNPYCFEGTVTLVACCKTCGGKLYRTSDQRLGSTPGMIWACPNGCAEQ